VKGSAAHTTAVERKATPNIRGRLQNAFVVAPLVRMAEAQLLAALHARLMPVSTSDPSTIGHACATTAISMSTIQIGQDAAYCE
jgi:hypothetical protein